MLIHRGIVVDGENYKMLEGVDSWDSRELWGGIGTSSQMYISYTASAQDKYDALYYIFDNLNHFLVDTIATDLIYQMYVHGEDTLVFRDDNGDPVITYQLSSVPRMYYATYNTATFNRGVTQLGTSDYPAYDMSYYCGVKFRMLAAEGGGGFTLTSTRHSDGTTRTDYINPKKYFIDDFRIDMEAEYNIDAVNFVTDNNIYSDWSNARSGGYALFHKVWGSHDELEISIFGFIITAISGGALQYDYVYWDPSVVYSGWNASNINFESYIIPEVGYMNDLENRFSPRYMSNGIGMYIIPQQGYTTPEEISGIRDVARSLMETNVTSAVSGMFSQGKECVLGVRWYYGLKDKIEALKSTDLYDISVGGQRLSIQDHPIAPTIYMHAHYAKGEFVLWKTSKLNVSARFNNYLDFCTSYKLYLPYYGFMDIDANDIVGGTIQVFYNINIVTGATMITVACNNSRSGNEETKYYSVSTEVGHTIPFGVDIMQSEGLRAANMIKQVGSMLPSLAMGGAQIQAGMQVNQANKLLEDIGNEPGTDTSKIVAARDDAQNRYNKTNTMQSLVKDFDINAQKVAGSGHSTGVSNETGNLDELHPYLLITRPVNVEPADYEDYVGLPSSQAVTLSQCSGFTQVAAIKPQSLTSAPKYFNEIMSLLQAGVYL